MLKNIATALLCTVAPAALLAEPVELRSTDGFISVEGEIVGFNGVMLSVETSVGLVSVPASEVVCYGEACLTTIASNDFGLGADAFQDVFGSPSDGGGESAVAALEDRSDDFVVSFDAPMFNTLYRTLAGAFAVAGGSTSTIDLTQSGQIQLQNEAGNEVAVLTAAADGAPSDLSIGTVALDGSAAAEFTGPSGWALASQMSHQLIGLKAFAVVIAPNVRVDSISMEQLAGIYAGEITNWSEVGGPDLNLLPLQLPANSAVRNELIKLVMEPAGKSIAGNVLTMADEAGIAASVNQFPGSISVVSLDNADDNLIVPIAGECGVAVRPKPFNIVSGDYPLVRPIMAGYDRSPNTSLLTEMFDFAASPVAQGLISREGFLNQSAITQPAADKSERLSQILAGSLDEAERLAAAQMFQVVFEAERLSPTMSGGAASGPEGAWNRAMFGVLAEALKSDEYSGKEVVFVGFGASENGSQAAIDASIDAAADMRAAFASFGADVIASNGLTVSSFGFGGVAAATCYDGQVTNDDYTRVEVWLR